MEKGQRAKQTGDEKMVQKATATIRINSFTVRELTQSVFSCKVYA